MLHLIKGNDWFWLLSHLNMWDCWHLIDVPCGLKCLHSISRLIKRFLIWDLLGQCKHFHLPEFYRCISILIFCQNQCMSSQGQPRDARKMLRHIGFVFLRAFHRVSWPIIRLLICCLPQFYSRGDCLGLCSYHPKAFVFWHFPKLWPFSLLPMMFGCQRIPRLQCISWEMQSRFRMLHWGFATVWPFSKKNYHRLMSRKSCWKFWDYVSILAIWNGFGKMEVYGFFARLTLVMTIPNQCMSFSQSLYQHLPRRFDFCVRNGLGLSKLFRFSLVRQVQLSCPWTWVIIVNADSLYRMSFACPVKNCHCMPEFQVLSWLTDNMSHKVGMISILSWFWRIRGSASFTNHMNWQLLMLNTSSEVNVRMHLSRFSSLLEVRF